MTQAEQRSPSTAPQTKLWGRDPSRAADVCFWVLLVLAVPYLLYLGQDRWFFSDDWNLIAGREPGAFDQLFRPNNAHWTTVPAVVYDLMWRVFGIRSYVPYQLLSVLGHLGVVVLLRNTMLRCGVSSLVALLSCAAFIVFGPGADNIVWAFQIAITGGIAFGLLQIRAADHDGPIGWPDLLGVVFGLLALMCSGVGITMAIATGITVAARRGMRTAAVHVVPLAIAYIAWFLAAEPQSGSPFGRPSLDVIGRWLVDSSVGTVEALGGSLWVSCLLAIVLVTGTVAAVSSRGKQDRLHDLSAPLALVVSAVAFSIATAFGRWHLGADVATSSRYIYVTSALLLPLVAVAVQALVDRHDRLLPVLGVLLLVPVPGHIAAFDNPLFGQQFFDRHENLIGSAAYSEVADQAPQDARPLINPFVTPELDMGFLREARAAGKLSQPALPLEPGLEAELALALGLTQDVGEDVAPDACKTRDSPLNLSPAKGTRYHLSGPVTVTLRARLGSQNPHRVLQPLAGDEVTVELAGLRLTVGPPPGATRFGWCEPLAH